MKKILFYTLLTFGLLFSIISCGSNKVETEPQVEPPQIIEEPEITETVEIEIPEEIPEEDEIIEILDEYEQAAKEEYLRSIDQLDASETVTKEEFEEDKAIILQIISELDEIMNSEDFNAWIPYIEEDSLVYYSNPVNLRKAQRKHPNKLIEIKTLSDYFRYVFIQARKNKQIDEIRYISKTSIKAVKVYDDMSVSKYYEFKKIDGKWLVHLPTFEEMD